MEHLDSDTLARALGGDAETRARFAQHLATPCETCEAFLSEPLDFELLEGEVDRMLLDSVDSPRLDEVGFARVKRALGPAPSRAGWLWAALGVAASLLVVVGLSFPSHRPEARGEKGMVLLSVELSAVARSPGGQLKRITPGEALEPRSLLLLRYHATDAAHALLFRQEGSAPPEPVGAFELQPGTHDLSQDGALAGLAVDDVQGRVTFWLVASLGRPPTPAQALAAIATPQDVGELVAAPFAVDVGRLPSLK
jgi:hypothetical protein